MNNQDLLDRGYGRYAPHKGEFNTDLFQKWVKVADVASPADLYERQEGGEKDYQQRLYSIEVYRWQFPDHHVSYQFEVTFYQWFGERVTTKETAHTVTIEHHGDNYPVAITHSRQASFPAKVIDELENWFWNAYQKLNFIPDPHNQ